MRLIVELSGEHAVLAQAELEAVVDLAGGAIVEVDGAAVLVDLPDGTESFLRDRLALAHSLSAHWWTSAATPRVIVPPFGRIDMKGQRFAIRARRLAGAHPTLPLTDTVRAEGAILAVSGKVDLESPEVEIRMLVSESVHVGALWAETDRAGFEARHVKHRAHFAPVSIHPLFARVLVNLAGVSEGDRVADPFCGTGGLLLEAGLVGAHVFASDLDPRMVAGTEETLARFGVTDARVQARDVGELPEFVGEGLDVVLSDPPYGRSSTTNREEMDALYDRFFHAAHEALRPRGRLGVIFPTPELRARCAETFQMEQSFDQRVHRSMTRHWGIFRRA